MISEFLTCIPLFDSIGIPFLVFLGIVVIFLLYLGLKAQKRPKCTGEEEMIGLTGVITMAVSYRGRSVAEVRGELWWCRSQRKLLKGMEVRITGITDMILDVEPVLLPNSREEV